MEKYYFSSEEREKRKVEFLQESIKFYEKELKQCSKLTDEKRQEYKEIIKECKRQLNDKRKN